MTIAEVKLLKPRKICVPLAMGLKWRGGGNFFYQEKIDGEFAVREVGWHLLAGEFTADGEFYAFDVIRYQDQDVLQAAARERVAMLGEVFRDNPVYGGRPVRPVAVGNGGEFLEAVLARGGEGVVAKEWDSTYDAPMFACKRLGTWICAVIGFCGGTQSVSIADTATGQPRGRVALRGGKCDQVRIGSLIKVEGFGLTAAGMIREPRPCKDTATSWLVNF